MLIMIFYRALAAFVDSLLSILPGAWLPKKIQRLIELRKTTAWPKLEGPWVHVHAASGEIEYAKPVIQELRRRHPSVKILVTYSSVSALRLHRDLAVDAVVPLPIDRPAAIEKFLAHFRPILVLIARTDLWPTFLVTCRSRNIPVMLFSAVRTRSTFFKSFLLGRLTLIFAVSEDDARFYQDLTSTPVLAVGDTRYDRVVQRLESLMPEQTRAQWTRPEGKTIMVLGSTWPEEESVWLKVMLKAGKDFAWICAPHELSGPHLEHLESTMRQAGLRTERFSTVKTNRVWTADVLLLDEVGHLAEIYLLGDLAFVGGSFTRKVHSVMEPLAAGLPVCVGPRHTNNREAIEFQDVTLSNGLPAVGVVRSSEEALRWLLRWQPYNPLQLQHQKLQLRREAHKRTGVSRSLVDRLGLFDPTESSPSP